MHVLTPCLQILIISCKKLFQAQSKREGERREGRSSGDTLVPTNMSFKFPNCRSGQFAKNNPTNFATHIHNRIKALNLEICISFGLVMQLNSTSFIHSS